MLVLQLSVVSFRVMFLGGCFVFEVIENGLWDTSILVNVSGDM